MTTKTRGVMACLGVRLWRAVARGQLGQVGHVKAAVAGGGFTRFLEGQIDRVARRAQARRWPGVQFIHQGRAQRVVKIAIHSGRLAAGSACAKRDLVPALKPS